MINHQLKKSQVNDGGGRPQTGKNAKKATGENVLNRNNSSEYALT